MYKMYIVQTPLPKRGERTLHTANVWIANNFLKLHKSIYQDTISWHSFILRASLIVNS